MLKQVLHNFFKDFTYILYCFLICNLLLPKLVFIIRVTGDMLHNVSRVPYGLLGGRDLIKTRSLECYKINYLSIAKVRLFMAFIFDITQGCSKYRKLLLHAIASLYYLFVSQCQLCFLSSSLLLKVSCSFEGWQSS